MTSHSHRAGRRPRASTFAPPTATATAERQRLLRLAVAAAIAAGLAAIAALPGEARAGPATGADLLGMSIEQLMNVEVTSVSRKSERMAQATSAVYVITQDDIRRSGARSLPEALRLAPGITVLQIDGNKWAVGSRGMVGRFANKLLVMMDGRVLYSTIFSGVFWDAQATSLDDIERIEVIRGPGGTVWGTNAVNGVINIITRKANVEPGAFASLRVESDGSYDAALRHAASLAGGTDYRVFLAHQEYTAGEDATDRELADDTRVSRAGARIEHSLDDRNRLTGIAEVYHGDSGMTAKLPSPLPPYSVLRADSSRISGGFVSAGWSRSYASGANSEMRVVYDVNRRTSFPAGVDARVFDVDVQHDHRFGRHALVFGLTYRSNHYDFVNTELARFAPTHLSDWLVSAFVQDDIELVPEKLRLTVGSKFERNTLAGTQPESLPSVRLLWQPDASTNVWGAVTRAIRTPSQGEKYATLLNVVDALPPGQGGNPLPLPMRFVFAGQSFGVEHAVSYEAGVRRRLGDIAAVDVAAFHADYGNVRGIVGTTLTCSPSGIPVAINPACLLVSDSVVTTTVGSTIADASVDGGEIVLDLAVSERWRVRASYAYAEEHMPRALATSDPQTGPMQQLFVQSDWRLTPAVSLGASLRWVDSIPVASGLPSHLRGALNLNWTPNAHWQVSLTAHDLLDSGHIEYLSEINDVVSRVTEPRASVQVRWTF